MRYAKTALGAVVLALGSTAGCAGNEPMPAATLNDARQTIEDAERVEAQRFANRELNLAREKLDQARQAQEEGDELRAARLAEHAQLDAAYAAAVAENQELQVAVRELQETLDTLRSELERSEQREISAEPRNRQSVE